MPRFPESMPCWQRGIAGANQKHRLPARLALEKTGFRAVREGLQRIFDLLCEIWGTSSRGWDSAVGRGTQQNGAEREEPDQLSHESWDFGNCCGGTSAQPSPKP